MGLGVVVSFRVSVQKKWKPPNQSQMQLKTTTQSTSTSTPTSTPKHSSTHPHDKTSSHIKTHQRHQGQDQNKSTSHQHQHNTPANSTQRKWNSSERLPNPWMETELSCAIRRSHYLDVSLVTPLRICTEADGPTPTRRNAWVCWSPESSKSATAPISAPRAPQKPQNCVPKQANRAGTKSDYESGPRRRHSETSKLYNLNVFQHVRQFRQDTLEDTLNTSERQLRTGPVASAPPAASAACVAQPRRRAIAGDRCWGSVAGSL